MDRRSNSNEGKKPPPPPPQNPDVFDDEYAVDPDEDDFMPSVSDGFRPAHHDQRRHDHPAVSHEEYDPFRPKPALPKPADPADLRRMATRNSIAKVPYGPDHQRDPHQRGPSSQATPSQHRESFSSTASFATMANSDTAFGSGPSHPYAMYQQNTMARNASISTASTQQTPQPSASPPLQTGPSHPYAMYPQNVVEDEPPAPVAQTGIPVGFPGINTSFHRQIGPDGEEQDILDPFGHTEQLPPYSRYPDEGPTKASMAAEASATPNEPRPNPMAASNNTLPPDADPLSPPSPVSPVSPLAPIAPAFLPQQRPETQTGNVAPRPATTSESASLLTTEESPVMEKSEQEPSLKKANWRSKRLWGKIPVTVALILLVLLLIFAVVIGAAIGTFLTKNKDKPPEDQESHPPPHEKP
jgi:hypothetical protein